ncbi:hypothetical protein DE146DRAFT_256048 [Phaeosphaeria sp. MPI-PUGE-AT-0046c]|nr:hypothetical protein DE146DRAFT_256048 [Phaeosphaeria sp. MPI-PUGE-AT-0046c]
MAVTTRKGGKTTREKHYKKRPPPVPFTSFRALREARAQAGVGDTYTCCLNCLQPAHSKHRDNWLDCLQCHAHGASHKGDLCLLLRPMSRPFFFEKHVGETRRVIYARSKSGRAISRREMYVARRRSARRVEDEQGTDLVEYDHQPDVSPPSGQGCDTQRPLSRSPPRSRFTPRDYDSHAVYGFQSSSRAYGSNGGFVSHLSRSSYGFWGEGCTLQHHQDHRPLLQNAGGYGASLQE